MTIRKGIIVVIVVVLVGVAAFFAWSNTRNRISGETTSENTLEATTATRQDTSAVFAEGVLAPERHTSLATEVDGRVEQVSVAEGDAVEAGDVLLRQDSSEAQIAARQAQAAVAQAEANVATARAQLQSAEEGLQIAQLGIRAAEAQLAALTADPREEAVALAESGVAAAEAGVAQAAGERDVTLEPDTAAIATAEARLEAAEANLFAVRIAEEPQTQNPDLDEDERAQAQLRLNAAMTAVEAARAELEALQQGATEAEARAAANAVSGAAQQREAAQAELGLLQVGPRPEAVAVTEAEVQKAREQAAEREAQVAGARSAVRQAEAELEAARSELEAAQSVVERHTLHAAYAGTVVQVNAKVGQRLAAGVPAVLVADFSTWQVQTSDLSELDVVRLQEGQTVQVGIDAFPDEVFEGQVVQIADAPEQATGAPLAQTVPGASDDVNYEVTVVLNETGDWPLRWGMTAFVAIGEDLTGSQNLSGLDTVNIEGRVEPNRFVELAPEIGGTVAEVLVDEGQRVTSGQFLLRLDTEQQEIALAQARSQLTGAEAASEAAQTQRALAEAAVETARAEAQVAEAQLALTQSDPLPEEIAAAESRLAAAQSGVAQAVAQRDTILESVGTEAQIDAARAELAEAEAELRTLQNNYETIIDSCVETPEGTVCPLYGPVEETTRAQLEAAQARVDAARTALERLQAGATTAQEQAANAGIGAAVARRRQAEAELALLQAGATQEEIRQAEVALSIAEAQVALAEAGVAEAEAAVAQAEAGVQAAQAGVEAAELARARATLTAPFDGVAVAIDAREGELATPQAALVTLATEGSWLVKTRNLTELDVGDMAPGDEVVVTFDALPDEEVRGTITEIALRAGMDRGDVVYEATIALPEDLELPLRWGMTAEVQG